MKKILVLLTIILVMNFCSIYFAYFKEWENDFVIKEEEFLTNNNSLYYDAPKSALIRNLSNTNYYETLENTPILDKPGGSKLRELKKGETLTQLYLEGEFGFLTTNLDEINGYIHLGDLIIVDEMIIYGVSVVYKVVKNKDSLYVLSKGEPVTIKESEHGSITILDEEKEEFIVSHEDLELKNKCEIVTLGSISSRSRNSAKIIDSAYKLIGKPYVYGDTVRRGYDCSGFTYSLYLNQLGIKLPRSSASQANFGNKVDKKDLAPGDLIFFKTTGKGISHVGLYIGEGNMIHASFGKSKIRIDNTNSAYYSKRYVTARRIVE